MKLNIYTIIAFLCFLPGIAKAQTEAEPNDNFAQANLFSHNTNISGSVNCSGDVQDFFLGTLPTDGMVRVYITATNTSASSGYLYFYTYDRNQSALMYSYLVGNSFSIAPNTTVYDSVDFYCRGASDSMYFQMYGGSQCFNYTLRYKVISTSVSNDIEPNNSFTQFNVMNTGDTAKGHIAYTKAGVTDNQDFYKASLSGDGTVKIYLKATNTSSTTGYLYFYVYDKNQSAIVYSYLVGNSFSIPPGTTVTDSLNIFCRSSDTMYFQMYQGAQCFSYELTYKTITAPVANDVEPNDVPAQALNLIPGDTAKGHINYSSSTYTDNSDYYRIVLPYDGRVRVNMQATNTSNSSGYVYLYMYDKNQTTIVYSYLIGNTFSVAPDSTVRDSIDLTCMAADTLYMRIYPGTQCFNYKLSYKMVNPPILNDTAANDNMASATLFNITDTISGHLNYTKAGITDNQDFFKTNLPYDGTVRIYIEATNTGSGNGYLYLYSYDQNQSGILYSYLVGNTYSIPAGATVYDSVDIHCRLAELIYLQMYAGMQCFNYRLSYKVIGSVNTNDIEPNNNFSQAVSINMNDVVTGNVNYSKGGVNDNQDFYKTLLPSDGTVRVYIEATNTSTGAGYFYLYAYDANQNTILGSYLITNSYNLQPNVTVYDTIDLLCQPQALMYFQIYGGSQCFNYKLKYEVSLTNDSTTYVCPGFTTDISHFYNTAMFDSVSWTNMSGGSMPSLTAVPNGLYRLTVQKGTQLCTRDTAFVTVALHPKPNLGNDTLVKVCPAFTTDITTLYNTTNLAVQWTGTSTPTAVGPGTYTLTVTNQFGCMDTAIVTVGLNPKPNLGNDTLVKVCPSYTTDITGLYNTTGLTTQYLGTASPTAVGPGSYTLIVTNQFGCMDTAIINVGLHPKPNLGNDTLVKVCPGFTTDITGLYNTTGLTTQWSTATPANVGVGVYSLTVTNQYGCMDTAIITVNLHPKPALGNDTLVKVCPGFTTDITGLYNTSGLTIQWTGTSTPTAVGPGTYTLTVTNQFGCMDTAIVTVNNNPKPNLGNDVNASVCPSFTIDLNSLYSISGLTVQWSGTATPTAAGPGTYTIVVTNQFGCKDTAVSILTNNPKPSLGADLQTQVCPGFTTDITTLYNTTGLTTAWQGTSTPATVSAGNYTLVVTNTQGCKDTANVTVTSYPKPNLGNDTTINTCPGFMRDLTNLYNTTGLTTQWTGTSTPASVGAGTYTLVVTNTQGCKDTAVVTVTQYPKPNLGSDQAASICPGTTTTLTGLFNTSGLTVQWSPVTPANVGNGVYTLIVTNTQGCKDTASITVNSYSKPNLGNDTSLYAWIGETVNFVNIKDTTGFGVNGWTALWTSSVNGSTGNTITVMPDTGTVYATLIVTNQNGCKDTANITIHSQETIVPVVSLTSYSANAEVTNPNTGWTNYYYNNNTPNDKSDDILLLSLKKNGNSIGTVNNGSFTVTNAETQSAGSGTGWQITNPLMTNPSGYWTMRRYWQVTATTQPTTSVGVRYYYNTQDYNDANGSVGGTRTMQQLKFYHLLTGNPNPATNWTGATTQPVNISNGTIADDTTWVYADLGNNRHRAEFTVAHFSGGSGGFTGNNGPLPIQLLSFNAKGKGIDAVLQWQSGAETSVKAYAIERGINGHDFTTIYTASAQNNGTSNLYNYTDMNAAKLADLVYYRIRTLQLDGRFSYSNAVAVRFEQQADEPIILPNPAHDHFMLRNADGYKELVLLNIHGEVVMQRSITSNMSVDISMLASGTYTVRLSDGKNTFSTLLVKQ